jgi:methionyl-tRNA synthetase
MRHILVTTALPYASGQLHLGHILENIQADIWVRLQKMQGHNCLFISGCDAHGTPIMIAAAKQSLTPEQLVAQLREQQHKHLKQFLIDLDIFSTTHSPENQQLVDFIYNKHLAIGNITAKNIEQAYDTTKNMFLPDRFIKGNCPNCKAPDQYGDNCEVCGSVYSPLDLIAAYSILSQTAPINKSSLHYFFKLSNYTTFLQNWINSGRLQTPVKNKLDEWLQADLKDWDISRDEPYFGFKLSNDTSKYYYCWLDAPIGYIAAFKQLCQQSPDLDFASYWHSDSTTELYHFIGKDIMYFHGLFWPAILHGAGLRMPNAIFAHGFLTINGQKMSKSRGTFVNAQDYLQHLSPELLRYYLASKLANNVEDLDINFNDLMQRINADLIGKFVNLASRSASFITRYFAGVLGDKLIAPELYQHFLHTGEQIAQYWQQLEYQQAIKLIMQLADTANKYVNDQQPWLLAKNSDTLPAVRDIATMALNCFRLLTIYLKPVLPATAALIENFLNIAPLSWQDQQNILVNHKINEYQPLMTRVTTEQIANLTDSLAKHQCNSAN